MSALGSVRGPRPGLLCGHTRVCAQVGSGHTTRACDTLEGQFQPLCSELWAADPSQPPSFASLRTCPERAENLPRHGGVLPGWLAFSLVSNLGHSCFNRAPHTRSGHLPQGPCILCI